MTNAVRRFVEQWHTWEEQLKPLTPLLDQWDRSDTPHLGPRAAA